MVAAAADTPGGLDALAAAGAGAGSESAESASAAAFVDGYGRLQAARAAGRDAEAARGLVRLVGERAAPRRHWAALLALCAPLFEEPAALWTAEELRVLLARLEQAASAAERSPIPSADIQLLQMALVRCMSRALVS